MAGFLPGGREFWQASGGKLKQSAPRFEAHSSKLSASYQTQLIGSSIFAPNGKPFGVEFCIIETDILIYQNCWRH
jgi:hypothetical protein